MKTEYNIFVTGKRYRAKYNFGDAVYSFNEGELLIYKSWGFVPYDGLYAYVFHSEADPPDAKDKIWFMPPRSSPDVWREYFELID
jgi:hypothetical protein